jgi:hypothetical protein
MNYVCFFVQIYENSMISTIHHSLNGLEKNAYRRFFIFIAKKITLQSKATIIFCTFAPIKALLNSKSFVDYGISVK